MAKLVEVPGTGTVEFPDSMPDEDIGRQIRLHTPEPEKKGSPEWVGWRNKRLHDVNDHALSVQQPKDPGFFNTLKDGLVNAFNSTVIGVDPKTGNAGGPIQGLMNLAESTAETVPAEAGKAVASLKAGDYDGAKDHALSAIPLIGPGAVDAGKDLGEGRPGAGAAKAILMLAPFAAPAAARGVSKVVDTAAPSVRPAISTALKASAEEQYARVLNPTKTGNKIRTAAMVPELIDRGIVTPSLKALKGRAEQQIASVGAAIGDEWQNLPAGSSTPLKPIFDRLQSEIDTTHSITDAAGKRIPKGPEGAKAVGNIESLQQVLMDVAEKDPTTGELRIPVEKARDLRQYFDKVQKSAGSFEGKNLNDASTAAAHEIAANSIREELGKQFPSIDALNKEYSFWKNVDQVTGDTLMRRQGQAVPLGQKLAQAGGFIKGGVMGAEAMKALTQSVQSPAWATVSAVLKDRLANALAKGNRLQATSVTQQIRRTIAAKTFNGPSQRTPELAEAPTK